MGGLPSGQRRGCWNWTWVQARTGDIQGQEPCKSIEHWERMVSLGDCMEGVRGMKPRAWGVRGEMVGKEPSMKGKSILYHLCQGARTSAHRETHWCMVPSRELT